MVEVPYSTGGRGTATEGVDYLPTSGVLVFAPGTVHQEVRVAVVGDAEVVADAMRSLRVIYAR